VTVLAHCALGGVELVVVGTEPRRAIAAPSAP